MLKAVCLPSYLSFTCEFFLLSYATWAQYSFTLCNFTYILVLYPYIFVFVIFGGPMEYRLWSHLP